MCLFPSFMFHLLVPIFVTSRLSYRLVCICYGMYRMVSATIEPY